MERPVRFGVIGLDHGHIYGQTNLLLRAGAELVAFHAAPADLAAAFGKAFPDARPAAHTAEIIEDEAIDLIVTAAVPADRAAIALAAMRHGKDVMSDKPGCTTLDQLAELRRVQAETARIFSVCFSERFENRATVRAGELVAQGAIGRVLHTAGFGPHRANLPNRPPWFVRRERYGGILTDIAAHQADQFLHFTGSTAATVVAAQVANYAHPEQPGLEDFGEVLWRGDGGSGYARVDWFTPDGLPTWGDTRLTVLGTEGYIEVRKNVDIAGRPGGDHLFIADGQGVRYEDCKAVDLPYGPALVRDIRERTETAMGQAHSFLACDLSLRAEAAAVRLGYLGPVE